ncbi:MAG: hypothetical protein CO108_01010 [Deltaproteobacteria bacterium CG_4_9_14_3_um_filter_63_12]|nr:MAG: hypothetical protein CO108_01010 [Deltaproteobacteria bacterium CG_4_9_14_3_um_filter_63_12]
MGPGGTGPLERGRPACARNCHAPLNTSKERWCADFKILLQRRDVDLPGDREVVAQLHSIKRRGCRQRELRRRAHQLVLACQKERGARRGGEAEVVVRVIG